MLASWMAKGQSLMTQDHSVYGVRRGRLMLTILVALIVGVVALVALVPRAQIRGEVFYSWGNGEVARFDCASGKETIITRFASSRSSWSGISGPLAGRLFIESESQVSDTPLVFALDTRTGQAQALCPGAAPAECRSANSLVYFAEHGPSDSVIALLRRRVADVPKVDTLGFVRPRRQDGIPLRYALCPPVEVEGDEMITIGRDGGLWIVNVQSGAWHPLGIYDLRPLFWQPGRRLVVCMRRSPREEVVALDLSRRSQVRLPALDGISGFAPSQSEDKTLVVLPGWFPETRTTKLYDWRTGRARTLPWHGGGLQRMVWIE